MITAIVVAGANAGSLAVCLASLVPAAVDGIVRDVIVVNPRPDAATLALADDAGARMADSLGAAATTAKGDWLLILETPVRLEDGWHGEAAVHVQQPGGRAARFRRAGLLGGFLRTGLLVPKGRYGRMTGRSRVLRSRANAP